MSRQDEFDCIVNSLNEAVLNEARWQDTSALIDEAFGSHGNVLIFGTEHAGGTIEIFFSRFFYRGVNRTDWQRDYFCNYHAGDEHLPRLRVLPDSKIVHRTDLFSEQELKTSLMYNEALSRYHGQDGLSVRLDGLDGSRIVWSIADPIDAEGWSTPRLDMIANVLPHLRQYVHVHSAIADAGALGTSISELLDNAQMGIVQLDHSGLIVEANDCARNILRKNDGLYDSNGALHAITQQDNLKLNKLLGQALASFGKPGTSGSMVVRRPSLLPMLALHVKPVTLRETDGSSRKIAALVLIIDPAERIVIDAGIVESALGLTPAETEVVVLLAQGHTLRQIAAIRHCRYSTVRTYLKHIFTKLGASRQIDVVRLVLALSKLPGSKGPG